MIYLGDYMKATIKSNNIEDLIVSLEDLDNEDDLVLLSKEIEKTKLDDTINLSKYLSDAIDMNKETLIKQKNCC